MAGISPARARISGVLLVVIAGALGATGLYLAHLALNWTLPAWLPAELQIVPGGAPGTWVALADGALGWAAAYLMLFGVVAGLNGLWMLVLGRRNALLGAVLVVLFLVFLGAGLWAALGDGPWTAPVG